MQEALTKFRAGYRATVSLLAYRIAQQQNLFINKLKCPSLVNASGLPVPVEGTATVNICANDLSCSVDAVISSDLRLAGRM